MRIEVIKKYDGGININILSLIDEWRFAGNFDALEMQLIKLKVIDAVTKAVLNVKHEK